MHTRKSKMNEPLTLFDIIALAVCIFVLFGYHVVFYYFQRNSDMQSSFNVRNVTHWLHKHKVKSDATSGTLAIHTLRNTIMVAVFIGGYALNVAYISASEYEMGQNKRIQVRATCLAILLFGSFLCWAIVIRYAAQLGYLIGTLDYEDKSDLEVLEHLPGHSNGGTLATSNDSEITTQEASPRTKARAEFYPFDRKIALKTSEHILQSLLLYFRSAAMRVWFICCSYCLVSLVLDSDFFSSPFHSQCMCMDLLHW